MLEDSESDDAYNTEIKFQITWEIRNDVNSDFKVLDENNFKKKQ